MGLGAVICVVSYAIHWYRERIKWTKIREGQLEKLKQLKRLKWYKKRIETAVPATAGKLKKFARK